MTACCTARHPLALALLGVPLLATSCVIFRPRNKPADRLPELPERYRGADGAVARSNRWWRAFGDPELNALVEHALQHNLSLHQVAARLDQAAATATQRGAALYPEFSVEAKAARTRQSAGAESGSGTAAATATASGDPAASTVARSSVTRETYSLGLAAGYELDLWGRVRAARAGAGAELQATRAELETAAMTLAAEVTLRYLELLWQREQLTALRRQHAAASTVLELVALRQRRSQATALDVLRQQENVARIAARIPPVKAREQALLNALAVLTGRAPGAPPPVRAAALPDMPPQPEAGLPADLLSRRPDIRASALRLRASDWSLSAARADRLPALRLSASASYSASELAELFDDWVSNLAAALTGPLIDGGRRRAEVARARAAVRERLAAYREQVIEAVREVQDELVNERQQRRHVEALSRQLAAGRSAADLALEQYRKGVTPYLDALTASIGEQTTQLSLARARHDLLAARVRLYRALGGDWTAAAVRLRKIQQENTP